MHRLLFLILWIGSMGSVAGAAYSQEQPPKEALTEAISQLMPPYWSISDIKIIASVNLGDAVDSNFKQRFEAVVSPSAALFVRDAESEGAYGPFVPVLPTLNADASRTLYGVANATYAAGQWSIAIKLENDISQLGMPLDMFPAPTIVRGSEEEGALRERLRADVTERVRRQLDAEEERVRTEHAAAVRALRSQYQNEIQKVETEHAAAMTKLRARLASAEQAIIADLERLAANHAAALKNLKERQERERAQLVNDQEQILADRKLQHDEAMKGLEQQFAQEAEKARTEIQAKTDLVALEREKHEAQAKLMEAQQETAKRDAQLAEQQHQAKIAAHEREMQAAEEQRQHQASLREAARADHAKRLSTLGAALSGEDKQVAVAAFQAAMVSGDAALQTAAMREALSSDSTVMKELALHRAIMNSNTVSFAYNGKSEHGDEFSGSLSLLITKKIENQGSISFDGKWRGAIFRDIYFEEDTVHGNLSGLILSATSKYCSLTSQLTKESRLEGSLQCDSVVPPGTGSPMQAAFGIAAKVL
jgi:hypothetical protein